MIVQAVPNLIVRRSDLPAFQADHHIGSQTVHHVTKVALVLGNKAWGKVGIAVILLPTVNIERQPRCDRKAQLRPATGARDRYPSPSQDTKTLPQSAQDSDVPAMEKHSGKLHS